MVKQLKAIARKLFSSRGWAYGLFWSWNVIFLAFMFLGFAPLTLPEMITAVRMGTIPAMFLVYAVILTAIPAVAVILGLTVLRHSPGRLFTFGYGIEGPLMLMLAIRFFAVREATLAVTLLLSIAVMGMATLLWQVLDQNIDTRRSLLDYARVMGLTLLLTIGLYVSVWIAFYVAPVAVEVVRGLAELVRNAWRTLTQMSWQWIPYAVLGIILFIYTATLFVAMPIAVPILYIRAWRRGLQAFVASHGWLRALALTAIVLATCAVLFVQTNRQPQRRAFELLKNPPATLTEAKALLDKQETIRAGLLNAYLAPFRYISAVGEVRHVREMYKWSLKMSQEQAARIEQLYETVARPLLYEPVNPPKSDDRIDGRALREEPVEAAKLYQTFFDRRIIDGEHETIVNAVRSTWSFNQAEAAWQAVDDREIQLTRQEITVMENGDWAEVELYEVYQNKTEQRQEVVYYFSLPESAVITGVWLGNSPDRSARFAYRVSPRGAAQAVYRNEVRRQVDPALVEQIGPRQYRLRVFPVEPRRWVRQDVSERSTIEPAPPLYMWLTFRVLASGNAWPLPHLAEKRNVYWDAATVRLVNGKPVGATEARAQAWLPASVPAAKPVKPVAHRVDFPSGETVVIRPTSSGDLPQPASGLKLAVVLDRSRSMAAHAADVKAALDRLTQAADSGATVDVYLTASKYRGEAPSQVSLAALDPNSIIYYGGQNAAELLAQFGSLHASQRYDAVFVLTDGSGYELGNGDVQVPIPDAPVWMVHLGGEFPLGYDDATLQAIQASGGGVASNVGEALTRLAVALKTEQSTLSSGTSSALTTDVIDGYEWTTAPTEVAGSLAKDAVTTHAPSDSFAALAARRLILAEMHRQRGALAQVSTLDHLHAIAVEHSIVTPYSSMIVLVTESQKDLLERLEANSDRFQREYEQVGDTTPQSPFEVAGVPEPEEWLLLVLAAGLLLWFARTKRRTLWHERIS